MKIITIALTTILLLTSAAHAEGGYGSGWSADGSNQQSLGSKGSKGGSGKSSKNDKAGRGVTWSKSKYDTRGLGYSAWSRHNYN